MALTDKLSAIGTAIRNKTGKTELMTLDEMPTEIASITSGGDPVINPLAVTANGTYTATDCDGYSPITVNVPQDGAPTDAELTISGYCSYRFANGGWDWVINKYGNRITTNNITSSECMFQSCNNITQIPFQLNFNNTNLNMDYMFSDCNKLTSIPNITLTPSDYFDMLSVFQACHHIETLPYIYNAYPSSISSLFMECLRLRNIPEDYVNTWNFSRLHSYNYASSSNLFASCYSLRKVPDSLLQNMWTPYASSYSSWLYSAFQDCSSLDEIVGLPVPDTTYTSNMFSNTFNGCYRLKNIIFSTSGGQPYVVEWKNQIIDLTNYVGYTNTPGAILGYNSGITEDKKVTDEATYQALKDDPDWFTTKFEYSRYNHDSAVLTINSLPDASAYIIANDGTNTIKFLGNSGSSTDGGAINTLTEAEIAVATAKGWTVSLV